MWRVLSFAGVLLASSQGASADPADAPATIPLPMPPPPPPAAQWAHPPSAAAVGVAYPEEAAAYGISGSARVNCLALAEGKLTDCHIVSETPRDVDFGRAAVTLAPHGTIVTDYNGKSLIGERVEMSINFFARRRGG